MWHACPHLICVHLCLQIPTFRATPLHPECDKYCDFPVADRANAVQQWIDAVQAKKQVRSGQVRDWG